MKRAWLILLAAGLAVVAPTLILGVGATDSGVVNAVWAEGFTAALRSGQWPPRWIAEAYGGLGAPSFYFYPPLAFYVGAGLDALSGWRLDGIEQSGLTGALLILASGFSMFAWLRRQVREGWALIGALAYLAAPYHLVDHYIRGALAELAAYALLPLVLLALQASAQRPRRAPLLALAYAGLIYAHLPTALLASLFLLPAFAMKLLAERPDWRARAQTLAAWTLAALLGLALAASYLVPALSLQSHARLDLMWSPYFQAFRWALGAPDLWPVKPMIYAPIAWGLGLAALAALSAGLTLPAGPARRQAVFWSAAALFILVAMVPSALWRIALLARVQFPWRLTMILELAAITAAVMALNTLAARLKPVLAGAFALSLALAWSGPLSLGEVGLSRLAGRWDPASLAAIRQGRAPDEHLPAGFALFDHDPRRRMTQPLTRLAAIPSTQAIGPARVAATPLPGGGLHLDIVADAPAQIVIRRFDFPSWRLEGLAAPAIQPFGHARLVSFRVRAGRYRYRLVQRPPKAVRNADVLSLAALALTALALLPIRRRRMAAANGAVAVDVPPKASI